jgi:hypothetical protein
VLHPDLNGIGEKPPDQIPRGFLFSIVALYIVSDPQVGFQIAKLQILKRICSNSSEKCILLSLEYFANMQKKEFAFAGIL